MNNYHQIHSNKYTKSNYQENNKQRIETKHIQTRTAFYGTKSSPNAIIKNPLDGIPYLTENNETMTVGQYGKYFFRVTTSNTVNKESNHLYYEDISDYLHHHDVVLTDANISRKWKLKKENFDKTSDKIIEHVANTSDSTFAFNQPPWSIKA